ncbi:adenylosuccinate synthetase [Candidatus Bathyarchaeota archaeon]|nr:adenylosuccinate synthetase [Candidatus Bathyarchaeota archaeon]NIU81640.1 adenylosuccinate synthetase [Candidatus Bathyarchaeota archaeon]NIV68452.1 adenylosuccinate synthetase [Candidatus Bathyarchaeota archaeon]NIW16634.1 adenylosuccinate synthetase [Candidatus Bathyarchaeota archaeon]NIW34828.1 adenylosuccinate synthetase [Candidatus Bathyarchaeota archaeon]
MSCTVVVCGFFGDTGKGKIISHLSLKDEVAVAARAGVGPNAGHTVVYKGEEYKLRMLPSAFVYDKCRILIGPGVLVNPEILLKEIELTRSRDRVGVDGQCAVIEPEHIQADKKGHLAEEIKTTGTGTGPCNAERALRTVKVARDISELQEFLADVPLEVNKAIDKGENVVVEGTQGTYLSLFHGTYPYCTSKDVTASAACADVGVGPTMVDDVILVLKAYTTRVGAGPLPNELSWEEAKKRGWAEVATVTGRRRRAAPFNYELAKRAVMLNGATQAAVTKVDILFPDCKGVDSYEKLSPEARQFVQGIEKEIKIPVTLIGTGPGTSEIVDRRD